MAPYEIKEEKERVPLFYAAAEYETTGWKVISFSSGLKLPKRQNGE